MCGDPERCPRNLSPALHDLRTRQERPDRGGGNCRHVEAENVYREPSQEGNGWSLFGLAQALGAQGRNSEASTALADLPASEPSAAGTR